MSPEVSAFLASTSAQTRQTLSAADLSSSSGSSLIQSSGTSRFDTVLSQEVARSELPPLPARNRETVDVPRTPFNNNARETRPAAGTDAQASVDGTPASDTDSLAESADEPADARDTDVDEALTTSPFALTQVTVLLTATIEPAANVEVAAAAPAEQAAIPPGAVGAEPATAAAALIVNAGESRTEELRFRQVIATAQAGTANPLAAEPAAAAPEPAAPQPQPVAAQPAVAVPNPNLPAAGARFTGPFPGVNPPAVPAQTPITIGLNPAPGDLAAPPGGGLLPTPVGGPDAVANLALTLGESRGRLPEERLAQLTELLLNGQPGATSPAPGIDFDAIIRGQIDLQTEAEGRFEPGAAAGIPPAPLAPVAGRTELPSAIAASQAPALPASTQIADGIVGHAHLLSRNGQTDFQMRLDPPELGSVQIHLRAAADGVRASVVVATDAVKNMIESQIAELRQRLEAAGVVVNHFDVTREQTGQGGQGRDPRRDGTAFGDGDVPAVRAGRRAPAASPTGGLDVTV